MSEPTIGFIGGGNMAFSLIGGLLADGVSADRIQVSEPDDERRLNLQQRFGVAAHATSEEVVRVADVLVLAVKPQVMRAVCGEIAKEVQQHRPLVVSIAAGVRVADIERWLGGAIPLVRTMPNTPSLVQSGATALYANALVADAQKELAEGVMRAVGLVIWLSDERQMDAVTAISGSGPAYFFLLMEILEQVGIELGLPQQSAHLLALQTGFGATKMALESPEHCAELRQQVTSPGGTTERAIGLLEQGGIRELFTKAIVGARDRASELADMLGGKSS